MVTFANDAWIWVKSMYIRITLTKTTLFFFLFSFLHCFTHSLVQSLLYSLDANSDSLTSAIASAAEVPPNEFAWLTRSYNASAREDGKQNFVLRVCSDIPMGDYDPCTIVFESASGSGEVDVPAGFRKRDEASEPSATIPPSPLSNFTQPSTGLTPSDPASHFVNAIGAFVQPIVSPDSGNVSAVELQKIDVNGGEPITLNAQCTRVVLYADQVLRNSKREELALIGSEFWLLGISMFAIMYDSIPHLYAAVAFRVLSTGWSAYAIWRTLDIDLRFRVMITQGACGTELFPGYFRARMAVQIPELVLNVLALALSIVLVWRLARAYKNFMFQRVGAPDHVVKIYRIFLGLFTTLTLSLYLLVTSTALWVDQLFNGPIARISAHTAIYTALFISTLALLPFWLAAGWFSVRREASKTLLGFLSLGAIWIICWALMYYSQVFRWTWIQWPFFAALTVAAQLALIAALILGVLCYKNFGKGLSHYLHVNAVLEKADFEPEVFENAVGSDIEKRGRSGSGELTPGDRLSQTLDFGAHQPTPPLSPPAYNTTYAAPYVHASGNAGLAVPTAAANRNSRVSPLTRVTPPTNGARPQSFSVVLPTLPTLGKNDPWKAKEKSDDDDDEGLGI